MDENTKFVLDNLKEMEDEQVEEIVNQDFVGNESDNQNGDSNLEQEQ